MDSVCSSIFSLFNYPIISSCPICPIFDCIIRLIHFIFGSSLPVLNHFDLRAPGLTIINDGLWFECYFCICKPPFDNTRWVARAKYLRLVIIYCHSYKYKLTRLCYIHNLRTLRLPLIFL